MRVYDWPGPEGWVSKNVKNILKKKINPRRTNKYKFLGNLIFYTGFFIWKNCKKKLKKIKKTMLFTKVWNLWERACARYFQTVKNTFAIIQ